MDGVYGSERLRDEFGVCERDGVALYVACDIEARVYRGRRGCIVVSEDAVPLRNWRRYFEASDSTAALSSFNVSLSSEAISGRT